MKLKTSAIAMAVAGIAAIPMTAQAESGFYASVRIGVIYKDEGGSDDIRVQGVASRFGFRGETDLGNGLTGFGRYEFGLATEGTQYTPTATTDTGSTGGLNVSRRHAYVGLKGDFGKVTLGQTYHTYYNYISGPLDNPWIGSGFAMLAYTGRTAQGITYDNTWNAFSLGATLYMNDSAKDSAGSDETIDGYELAAAFDAVGIRWALGYQLLENDESVDPSAEPVIGLIASGWEVGPVTLGLSYAMQDGATSAEDATSIVFDLMGPAGFYFHYEAMDVDAASAPDPSLITVGYTQSLGRQTTAYYEYMEVDADTGVSDDDDTRLAAVLKYDWK